jgi:hypothetical protein
MLPKTGLAPIGPVRPLGVNKYGRIDWRALLRYKYNTPNVEIYCSSKLHHY